MRVNSRGPKPIFPNASRSERGAKTPSQRLSNAPKVRSTPMVAEQPDRTPDRCDNRSHLAPAGASRSTRRQCEEFEDVFQQRTVRFVTFAIDLRKQGLRAFIPEIVESRYRWANQLMKDVNKRLITPEQFCV